MAGARRTSSRQLVRGSSLLLAGRLLSKGANFAVQVLIVRYLSQSAYGAFAYAMSVVMLGQHLVALGLDRAITRFVPIYHEEGDYRRMTGTMFMVPATIIGLGLSLALLLEALQGTVGRHLVHDPLALSLLLVLIYLAPVQALDDLLIGLFAVFASPRAIFFRKHILAPVLKLLVVALLIAGGQGVFFLAGGYLTASALGVAVYTVLLVRLLRRDGVLAHCRLASMNIPWRAVLGFSIPLLTSDLVFIVMNTMDAVMLEYFRDTTQVAAIRAVQPAAKLNQLVMISFATLFTPMAARLFARKDSAAINGLYWQTAIWIAIFSFPVFALTFSLARPITLLLYGARYEQSALILAMLAFGYYFNAALGFNGLTLKVYGRIRYVVILNVVTAVLSLGLNLLLIPRYGALGAATGTLLALICHNVLKQAGLRLGTGINLFEWRYARVYVSIAAMAAALFAVQLLTTPPVVVDLALAAVASLLVLLVNRRMLTLEQTFPELARLPLVRWLLRSKRAE